VNRDVFIVASDRYIPYKSTLQEYTRVTESRSSELAKIAAQYQPHATVVADILSLPHPASAFDFAISIAVVHHLSTPARRVQAIASILRTLKPPTRDGGGGGGQALIYVWALEQKSSRRGWDKGHEQDVMVPWVLRSKPASQEKEEKEKTFHRFYHLYEEHELERDIRAAGGLVIEAGYEKDNWWAIAARLS
jgi:tRNA (uracil-5-)-methyltransferase TRM9